MGGQVRREMLADQGSVANQGQWVLPEVPDFQAKMEGLALVVSTTFSGLYVNYISFINTN